MQKRCFRANIN